MTNIARLTLLSTICLGWEVTSAVAQQVPRLDVSRTCSAEATPRNEKKTIEVCMADEQRAHEQLVKEWGQFSAESKKTCTELSRSFDPSYVELLTCLEDAQQVSKGPR